MIAHTEEEFVRSKALWGLEITPEGFHFAGQGVEEQRIAINLRVPEPHQIVFLAHLLGEIRGKDAPAFAGAVLWITARGIWDQYVESICTSGIELQRRGFGELRPLQVAPVHYFEAHEFEESISMLVWPMLAGWDALYYPDGRGGAEYYLAVSHEGFVDIVTPDSGFLAQVSQRLKRFNWIK